MPYYVTKQGEAEGCSGYAVVKADGEVLGCHKTKKSAVAQMVAVSLSEGIEPGGSYTRQEWNAEIEQRAVVLQMQLKNMMVLLGHQFQQCQQEDNI